MGLGYPADEIVQHNRMGEGHVRMPLGLIEPTARV